MGDTEDARADSEKSIKDVEYVVNLLSRSGYTEQASRLSSVVERMHKISLVLDMVHTLYTTGNLQIGPRVPQRIWPNERRNHP